MIVATEVVAEAQVTWLVRFSVELSESVPVAVNCWVVPLAMLGLAGVTAIETRTAGLTVSTVEPVTPPSVAVIVDVPVATPVARPAAVIVATEVVADAQVTWLVRSSVELSEKRAGGRELLGLPLGDAGVGRRHRDRLEDRRRSPSAPSSRVTPSSVALIVDVPGAAPSPGRRR